MMTSRMGGPGCVPLRWGAVAGLFLALAFTAGAVKGGDNAAFVSYSGVPSAMHPGDTATVTVTMKNTGTTTWKTTTATETTRHSFTRTTTSYSLDSVGDDWGVSGVVVSGSVARNATRSFRFTITAPDKAGAYTFQWRMSRTTVVTGRLIGASGAQGTAFGASTPGRTIQVAADTAPSFGNKKIRSVAWLRGKAIDPVTLPAATGGNGTLSYALTSCYLPRGLTLDRATRRLSGTPRTSWSVTTCTWKVTDADDNTAASDADSLPFTFRVTRPVLTVSPAELTVEEGKSGTFTVQPAMQPAGTVTVRVASGNGDVATVKPASLTFTAANYRAKTVTVTTAEDDTDFDDESTTIGLSASGGGYNGVSASVRVTEDDDDMDTAPSFGDETVEDQKWVEHSSVTVGLPVATGGNGELTYSLSRRPPDGVGFDDSALTLAGTPTAAEGARSYMYTVTDSDLSSPESASLMFTIAVEKDTSPELRKTGNENLLQGAAVLIDLQVTGGNAPVECSVAPRLPAGLALNASSCTVSGTPTRPQAATSYTFTATDRDGDRGTLSFTIAVEADTSPELRKTGNENLLQGAAVVIDLQVTGGNAPVECSVAPRLPAGLALNASSCTVSGTPTRPQAATPYTFTATDRNGDRGTVTFTIAVAPPDTAPSFGNQPIPNQEWVKGTAITEVTLPEASGGNGTLTYTLSPSPPAGLTFAALTRTLSGTPSATQGATTYAYTVTDSDANVAASDAATLTFTITVVEPDTAPSFGNQPIPNQEWVKGTAITEVALPEASGGNGTLTYTLSPSPPAGLTFAALTRTLSGTPSATQTATSYTYAVADSDTNTAASDAAKLTFTITVVEPDTAPSFGNQTIPNQEWVKGTAITEVALPEASGGNGTLTYTLSPSPPAGVTFSASARTLSGTPAATLGATTYRYTATDADGNTAASDAATLTFTITVVEPDTAPSFGNQTIPNQEWVKGTAITEVALPEASGGNGTLTYTLSPSPPAGVTFSASARTLSGTPSATLGATTYRYTATDADGNTAASDAATLTFTITVVEPDTAPSFGNQTIPNQEWVKGTAITEVALPEASGGNGTLTYTLSPSPPAGVTFSASARTLSGTPSATQTATSYTYAVADSDTNTAASDAAKLTFTITVVERGLALSATDLGVAEDGKGTFTVALATQPTGPVTVSVSSGDIGAAEVRPASLSFTTADYGTPQPVTVTGVQDDDADNESTTVSLTASGGDYDSVSSSVSVTVTDDDSGAPPPSGDGSPSFGASAILGQTWVKNVEIESLPLPAATGGNGDLIYALAGTLPAGVTFNASARTLSGTPTAVQAATVYTYTATDEDGEAASLSFTIEVAANAFDRASFVSYTGVPSTMEAGSSASVTVRMRNDGTTTWTSSASYGLGSQRPEDNVTWGLNRVSVPSDVPPNATADFAFTITAPAKVGSYKFRWRMVRGTGGWFGDKTEARRIKVEASASPSFGESAILAQTWVKGVAISSLTLPEASGGSGNLTYSLSPSPPVGVTFDAATRTLSGTPTKRQEATEYTYTATDVENESASLPFTIEVAGRASDDASFVSYADVPSSMAAGSSATVTVRMRNTGTTTWTSADGYALGSQRPEDNVTWGTSRVSLPSNVAPNATVDLTFAITAPAEAGGHKFRWRMIHDDGWFGDKTELREITVETDESPSFGAATIGSQTWVKNTAIDALTLPAATGGNGDLAYSLTGELPAGVTFDATTRTLSGTPAKKQAATDYTYTATDLDGDTATLAFTVEVAGRARDDASFVSYADLPSRMAAGSSATVTVRMQNTGSTTWASADGYALGSQRPEDNVTWGLSRVALPSDVAPNATVDFTFAITAPAKLKAHNFRWQMLRGTDGWFGDKTETVEIEVEDPSFGDQTIADQTWARGVPIDALTLPEASGSGGVLTYTVTPSLPAGVTFTESTRTVSGTPTAVQEATEYTYTATDVDLDAATLAFTIAIEAVETDDASSVSVSGVPSKMAAGGTATVTVTMQNTGTTTWTSAANYQLGSQSPSDNQTWGLSRVPVPSDVAPNATAAFTFTITAPETTGSYVFAWRMVRGAASWFGAAAGGVTITVEDPSFGDQTIAAQTWVQGTAIEALTLPEAGGGDGRLTYTLTPSLPGGVTFTESSRTLSGTPTAAQAATEYTYTATDTGGDAATLSFEIEVEAVSMDDAAFVSSSGVPSRMVAGGTASVTVTMQNTGTTTWTSSEDYELGSQSPSDNTTWGLNRVSLPADVAPNATAAFTFTITAPETTGSYVFAWQMVRGTASWFGAAAGGVTITVEDPSFGDQTIAAQTWVQGTAVGALTLPAVSGGDGPFTYTLTPSLPDGVTFTASTRTLSGTPTAVQAKTSYTYTATATDEETATLVFDITVTQASSSASSAATALPSPAPTGVLDMFEYWLLPRGSAVKLRARFQDGRIAPAPGSAWFRSFWRGELWGRKMALLGDPGGERYDIFEEIEDGLDYWGTFEGAAAGDQARPSVSLDRPFRWMNRFMAVGDVVESPVTGRLLSNRTRNQKGVLETTMRLEVVAHHASFTIPAAGDLTFEDVLEVRFWPDAERTEVLDTFYLAAGYGAVYSRRLAVAAAGEIVEWWAVEKALTPVAPSAPSIPWFDPFAPGWPKTAVLNGNLDDSRQGVEGGQVRTSEVPGWTAGSADATIARPPSGLDTGAWSMLLRGSDSGGDSALDAAITQEWIPVEGGTYQLSACMRRESAGDNVLVDFNDGIGRDADFADAHLVASSTGTWECRAVTKCIPASVGAVRIRAVRDGANQGDAWFDRIELKRIAACTEEPRISQP